MLRPKKTIYLMRARLVGTTEFVYWRSPNTPDTDGKKSPYPPGSICEIQIQQVIRE